MNFLWQDIRYGIRMLLKHPGFTAIAALTLALGIGANTAIFSVINTVLLSPLPYPDSQRLVMMQYKQSLPDLADIEADSKSFEAIGGVTAIRLDYTGGTEPQRIRAAVVTAGISRALGIQPLMGRMFAQGEDRPKGERLAVLTYAFWKNQMKSDPDIIGKTIPLSGNSYSIIGVLRTGFELPLEKEVDIWSLVRTVFPDDVDDRGVHFQRTYCLLAAGRSLQQAQAEMKLVDHRLEQIDPVENKDRKTVLIPLRERIVGDTRPALLILFGAVTLVLLIACSNYANLLLARTGAREQEIVIRKALGAGRHRLLRQLLTESVMLAIPAGILGLAFAAWGIAILRALQPESLPRLSEIAINGRVLQFTSGISVTTGLLFGFIPAQAIMGANLGESLKESGRSTTSGAGHHRLRSILVSGQLALSVLLLIGAGLLMKTFYNLQSVNPGFAEDGIITMRIELPEARYQEIPPQTQFRNTLLEILNSHPELKAGIVSELPLTDDSLDHNFVIEGRPPLERGAEPSIFSRSIQGDYFRIMQIPVLRGRSFTSGDGANALPVGILNQAAVRKYFPEGNALGARIGWASDDPKRWITIVGVAGDVKHFGLDQPEEPAIYSPYDQSFVVWKRWMNLVVHTALPGNETLAIIKDSLHKLDPQIPVTKVQWMSDLSAASLDKQRFNLLLLGIFAVTALMLSALGIYGVISHLVTQRTNEIGIRMALGAGPDTILRLVVGQCLQLIVVGTIIGLGGALALSRLLSGLVFGVGVRDPATFAFVTLLLFCVALCAGYFPARRAAKLDPMLALRHE